MKSWRSYRYKTINKNKGSSIAKDEVALLAERLEFFVPRLFSVMTVWQWLLYILFWSLFISIIERHDLATLNDFIIHFISRFLQNTFSIIPSLYLIDYLRPLFKRMNVPKASLFIIALLMSISIVSLATIMLVKINSGLLEYNSQDFILNLLFDSVIGGAFTLVFLIYFLHRYRELNALKQSFERKLTAQNDLMKSRLAPHFFFNTINSLLSLIESNPPHAAKLLEHLSALFRASFNGAREISFEEEVALCQHYLAVESYRLTDKLVVSWETPDDELMSDMVITALTLQSVIEKMLINVVEMTTEIIKMNILVVWEDHRIIITISVQLPSKTLMVIHDLRQQVNFYMQAERLQAYFGPSSTIISTVTNTQVVTVIDYPLQDAGL